MTLNPQVEALLGAFAQAPAIDWPNATPEMVRAANDRPMEAGPPPVVGEVCAIAIDLDGRTLDARLYVPEGANGNLPLLVYYHGGGWVIGTLDTHDATCRALCSTSGAAVLSVAYRLAPEHPFPAPLDDCYEALCWAADRAETLGIDAHRLAVGGDSAGGNLAGAVAIMARDKAGPKLTHQLLIYPVTDRDFSTASYADNGGGAYFLSTDAMRWFWQLYLGDQGDDAPPLAALCRNGDLAGLPPATIIAAQYDPLRDEAMTYAELLRKAGVPVKADIAPGMIHGFFSMFPFIPDAWPWIEGAGSALAQAFARKAEQ